jgi:NifB/MoaA-like Fe-S oxidoreductase
VFQRKDAKTQRFANVRTRGIAIKPKSHINANPRSPIRNPQSKSGTFLTGEMFAPILREQVDKYNAIRGSRLHVMAVPNTYFGGDVAVAGLLTGQDFLAVKDKIVGDFVTIPRVTIKSDEPVFLDGMTYDELKKQFPVPVYDLDTDGLIDFLSR